MTYEVDRSGQAEMEKFSRSTFSERKIMSTKTSIKRIAAVAALALTVGGFSAVTAHAADYTVTPSTTASTTSVTATTGTYKIVRIAADVADKYYTVVNSGGSIFYPSATPDTSTALSAADTATELWYSGATPGAAVFGASKVLDFSVYSASAGTQTITVKGNTNSGAQTIVITWGAAATFSTTNSKAYISADAKGASITATIDTDAAAAITAASNATLVKVAGTSQAGTIYVRALDNTGAGTAIATGSFSAVVSGSGLVSGRASGTAAMDVVGLRSATSYPSATGYAAFNVYGDNTSGTGTITITYTDAKSVTYALSTKTVTFSGSKPAKLVNSQSSFVAAAGKDLGSADSYQGDGAITASLTDSNGNPVASLTTIGSSVSTGWYLVSSNTACISSTIPASGVADGSVTVDNGVNNLVGTYNIVVTAASGAASGCTSSVTPHYYVSAVSDLAGTPITFTVGGTTVASVALTTDASSYVPGDKVKVTLTAKDSSGNLVADGSYGIFYNSATNIASAAACSSNPTIVGALAAGATASPISMNAPTTTVPFTLTGAASAACGTGTIAGSDKTYYFANGVVTSSFYAPYADGTITLKGTLSATTGVSAGIAAALLGSAVSASFTVATGANSASQAAVDAANEATDAANAATDAANNAMDSADAAQQAALDAGDKADAALAAVTDLATKVSAIATQIAALSALVKKIAAKVKA
jgi:hypothetical protein